MLKALRDFTYSTRRLKAGEVFDARKPIDAKILVAIKKAAPHRIPGKVEAPPAKVLAQLDHDGDGKAGGSIAATETDDLPALRAAYTEKMGKRPFPGWDADELHRRMNEGVGE